MHTAYILTGSNQGDRKQQLNKASQLLAANCGIAQRLSAIYETAPWGNEDQPAFLNQAIELRTTLTARQLIRCVLKIEKQMGRIRFEKYGPRIIDIDILLFDDQIHDYPLLKLPHPELPNRRFALTPLAEIAPDLKHPVLNTEISRLLTLCSDSLPVSVWK
jgi:2-amino-4-hydroxy-6-hydroxymethyldihydropteridine diphosphokinase